MASEEALNEVHKFIGDFGACLRAHCFLVSVLMHLCIAKVTLQGVGVGPLGFRANPAGSCWLALRAQLSLLRIDSGGRPVSVGDLRAEVEPEPDAVRMSMSPSLMCRSTWK